MTPLKPCPFCGKIPKIDTSQWKHNELIDAPMELVEQRVKIDCDECFLHMDIRAICYADLGLDEKGYRALAKRRARDVIVNVWNRRASVC